jgi:O-methyltransferase domain
LLYGDAMLWRTHGRLAYSIETGKPAFDEVHGQSFYPYLKDHPSAARLFNEAMTGFSEQEAAAIRDAYDFSKVDTIVDVGGGQGALMRALLKAHPGLQGAIFDREAPDDETRRSFTHCGIASRATFAQGDFFAAVPEGGDVYLLKSILHNWSDREAASILSKCSAAMPANGRLVVAKRVIPRGNDAAERSCLTSTCWWVWEAKNGQSRNTRCLSARPD